MLVNWLKVVNLFYVVFLFVVVLVWDEIFFFKIDLVNIEYVENLLLYFINYVNGLEYSLYFFEFII